MFSCDQTISEVGFDVLSESPMELPSSDNYTWNPNPYCIPSHNYQLPTQANIQNSNLFSHAFHQTNFGYQTGNIYQPQLLQQGLPYSSWMISPTPKDVTFTNSIYNNSYPASFNYAQCHHVSQGPVPPVVQLPKPKHYKDNVNMGKHHHAKISLMPTTNGCYKTIVKRKRKRTVFTTEQVATLERVFTKKRFITRDDRQILVNQLNLNDKSIKIWFQNRRLKDKRELTTDQVDFNQTDGSKSDSTALEKVENEINRKTDEFGFVTLDDGVIGDLVNVIDNLLPQDDEADIPSNETEEKVTVPIYEPISPASLPDSADEIGTTHWEPIEPSETLQRLFDLQTLISI